MTGFFETWQRRSAKGANVLRVRCGVYTPFLDDTIARGYKSGMLIPDTNGLVSVGPYKVTFRFLQHLPPNMTDLILWELGEQILTDGSLGSQTAYCYDCYPGTSNHGLLAYPVPTFRSLVAHAASNGFILAIHAIGDLANTIALETMASLPTPPLPGSTIEHAQLLRTEDLQLFKKLGVVASVQPRHLVDDRKVCEMYWGERSGRAFAFKSLVDAGVELRLGSDAPVASIDPVRSFLSAFCLSLAFL